MSNEQNPTKASWPHLRSWTKVVSQRRGRYMASDQRCFGVTWARKRTELDFLSTWVFTSCCISVSCISICIKEVSPLKLRYFSYVFLGNVKPCTTKNNDPDLDKPGIKELDTLAALWVTKWLDCRCRWGLFFVWGGRWCLGGFFKYFGIFTPIWGRFPFWLIFFRWVETTN